MKVLVRGKRGLYTSVAALYAGGGGGGSPATTWNPADKSSFLALSNSNRTVTYTNTGNTVEGLRSIASTSTQNIYFEIVIGTQSSTWNFGFATTAAPFNTNPASSSPTFAFSFNTAGQFFRDADSSDDISSSIPAIGNGDRMGIAFNPVAKLAWARKNGGAWLVSAGGTQDPATNAGGKIVVLTGSPFYAWVGMDANTGDVFTANFASTNWVDAAPSGYVQLA